MVATTGNAWRPWLALALCFIASVTIFLPYVGYSTQITQMMADLRMDYTMVGTLASATALSGGIVVYSAGSLFSRFSARSICIAGLAFSAAGQFLFSIAPSYEMMLFIRVVQGTAITLLFVGPYTIAMHWAGQSRRLGVFMGVMLATDGIGTWVASYAYSHVLAQWGWRTGSLWGAGALLFIAALLWLLLKEPQGSTVTERPAKQGPGLLKQYAAVLRQPNVVVAAFFLVGVWGTYSVAIYWVPTLLIEEAGWSEASAGFVGALYPLAGVVSAVTFGLLSDRLGRRKPLMMASGIGMVVAFVAAAVSVGEKRFDILSVTLPLGGLFAYGGLPLAYCIAADVVGLELVGTATGCIMGTGLLLGGMVYPLLLGYVRDATGLYTIGFGAAACSLLLFNFVNLFFCRDIEADGGEQEHDQVVAAAPGFASE